MGLFFAVIIKHVQTLNAKLLGLALMSLAIGLASAASSGTTEKPKTSIEEARRESDQLFSRITVVPLRINIETQYLGKLQKSYTNLAVYVPAEIQEGGKTYGKVGVRLRGVSTFQTIDEKPNFTIKFNEFNDGQKFHGLRKIRLSNAAMDGTYLQELLAWQLFNAAGVVAPRVNFARVNINGRDAGLYVLVEGVTKDFLKLNWGTDKGTVYEADETDIDGVLEQDYGQRNRHQTDLRKLVDAVQETDAKRRGQLLNEAIDLKHFSSYVAVEVLMNLWDGYSMRINNYRVFCNHDNNKVYFIPHGMDRLFDDPTDPIMPEWKGRVTQALTETPETRKLYLARLSELTRKLMVKEELFKRLDDATEALRPTLQGLNLDRRQYRALVIFKKRVERRIEVLGENLPALLKESESAGPKQP